ncbi:four helix bundle protein [Candidatus Falkowbacteria bacterium CG10_big_fil_rev_8_21_14_0_10_39_11]|uniref:Four helix bundle protein n=1 Tax=Candidatus Falkowbacteria bacterium CG10_big_fil_rev_8_21_14_0_10_39_11 TaxID=1974565 RepID=A0A2H0V5M2_9BACT|nr:MAG: four helix bundle protein [Candidatus Falkowbacteria bacterium CG10_big_fil_rev_8_21_14_0_10_39_11]
MKINEFYDLIAWKKAYSLVLNIYKITKGLPKEEVYGLISQMRRAAISITANIAEGFSRYHFKDKVRFYYQSRGSLSEVLNFVLVIRDLSYINEFESGRLIEDCIEIKKRID